MSTTELKRNQARRHEVPEGMLRLHALNPKGVSEGLSAAPGTNLSPDGRSTAARSPPVSFPSRITCTTYAFHKAEGRQYTDFFSSTNVLLPPGDQAG
ncbi:hypothetical protein MHYP_G00217950 [Metynnis hypsauchen]